MVRNDGILVINLEKEYGYYCTLYGKPGCLRVGNGKPRCFFRLMKPEDNSKIKASSFLMRARSCSAFSGMEILDNLRDSNGDGFPWYENEEW